MQGENAALRTVSVETANSPPPASLSAPSVQVVLGREDCSLSGQHCVKHIKYNFLFANTN